MELSELGNRICILGPSNSGKSTLANAIARKRDLKAVHLDPLYHLPNTNWKPRPTDQFITLHDREISGERWVIDGNYSKCLPQRLANATGLILLDITTALSLMRYFNRTLFEGQRNGGLEGAKERITWEMIRHITLVTPAKRKRYTELFEQLTIPKIRLSSIREIKKQFEEWELTR
ncbi:P-loop NTPase family protein [Hafnia psychrotolerans]|uniref:Topology modulation protein n=1 Tax=Hafnia psychrotolerans TaxID=1477018 RepID=A0ABQ1FYB5_9GAMM|nr:AAA family ATPase [Hafnia psychrotolerans]GGA32977.1 topology modulation protein [Hafnia psychrotolerans]